MKIEKNRIRFLKENRAMAIKSYDLLFPLWTMIGSLKKFNFECTIFLNSIPIYSTYLDYLQYDDKLINIIITVGIYIAIT